ncbi:MAG TPA: mechanosensitive ion channel family protein, partial [Bacillota bacterium]|nr:mechanosensitive ion channel family protein [Bacillota bacterium]
MEEFIQSLKDFAASGWKDLLLSALVVAAGFKLTSWIVDIMAKGKGFSKSDPIFQSFMKSFVGIILKGVTIITCAGILGVPMASIVAVISSAGLAIGLALQGSLSNFA